MSVSRVIRDELDRRRRTQSLYSIALGAGLNLGTLSRWASGKHSSMRLDELDRLAEYLGLELVQVESKADALEYSPSIDWEA
jgi:transcriptional regulator with XRE-family HTH domain